MFILFKTPQKMFTFTSLTVLYEVLHFTCFTIVQAWSQLIMLEPQIIILYQN